MTRPAYVALALGVASCATRPAGPPAASADPVERALAAMGGADAVAALDTLLVKGTARHWEPEQSVRADGEMRFAGESTFTATRSLATDAARVEWVRHMAYPAPREYRFTEVVTPAAGLVEGVDSTAMPRSATGTPPRHPMSGLRLAAAQRELLRTSPALLARMRGDKVGVAPAPDVQVGGEALPAVRYDAGGVTFTVMFDRASGLPARVRTLDADGIHGDTPYDLVLADWRAVAGVKLAHRLSYELGGREVVRIQYDEVQPSPDVAAEALEIPAEIAAGAPRPATGKVPYQWVIRRQFIGTYLDSDAVSYDPAATDGLKLVELAPGVAQVLGGSHNSLVVELADRLVVFDAPVDEAQSRFTIDAARARYGGKPVKELVLSHHHMDHTSGARTYVAEGATVIVGAGNGAHFARAFAAPHAVDDDALQRRPRQAEVVEVEDRKVIGDGKRTVELVRIENPHADGMLLGYVPDARIGWVVDLWSPGRDKLGDKLTPAQAALVAGVKKLGSTPERFAGGHGAAAEYAPLAALAAPPQAAR